MKTVIVTIGPDGKIESEVQGCKGRVCENLTKFLDEAFGPAKSRKLKPEYHQTEATHQKIRH